VNNMSQVWSEINKVVNVVDPVATCGATKTSDVVNLENYKKCTFLVVTGASVANTDNVLTVGAGATSTGAATAIAFKYRTQILAATPDATSDVPGDLTDATSTGFSMSASKKGGVYIIEVDAADVAAGTTGTTYYDHVALTLTEVTGSGAWVGTVIAILSEPRYPQAILQTAID